MRTSRQFATRAVQLKLASIAGLAFLLGACRVGPEYHRPKVPAPPDWSTVARSAPADVPSRTTSGAPDEGQWWLIFGDPVLDSLVERAAKENLDILQAGLRIESARAQRDSAASALYPSVSGSGIAGRTRMSENGIGQALSGGASAQSAPPPSSFNLFQAGFDASWELDLFGKTRRSVEAADADIRSAQAARRDALISLSAEIARTYFTLRGYERQLAIEAEDVRTQEHLQKLVDSRNRSGLVPASDVTAQQVAVAQSHAAIPQTEQGIALSVNRLGLLLAMPPGVVNELLSPASLPVLPAQIPVGLPGELLRRRADIRQSEASAEAATARIGVAEAALFPSIKLGLTGGTQSTTASQLFDWSSRFFIGGAQLSVPIFNGGKLRAQVTIADLQAQQAVLAYRSTVLNAFHEADNALVAFEKDQERGRDTQRQFDGALRNRSLAEARYRSGLSAYIDVLDAERQAHQAEESLADINVTSATDLVAVFKSLGGSWKDFAP